MRADHTRRLFLEQKSTWRYIRSETHSAQGRCDVVVQTATYIYVIELKLNSSAQEPLDQIIEKNISKLSNQMFGKNVLWV